MTARAKLLVRIPALLRGAAAAFLVVGGCSKPEAPPLAPDAGAPQPVDAGEPDAAFDAGLAQVPASTELTLEILAFAADGGSTPIDAQPGARTVVDAPARLEVAVRPGLANYRIRVFDDAERIVESDDEAVPDGPGRLSYRIAFAAPLQAGRHHSLVLDAQTGEGLVDRAGVKHPDLRIEFQTAGAKESPGKAKKPSKKKPKKRRR